jgi:hypothetical protein
VKDQKGQKRRKKKDKRLNRYLKLSYGTQDVILPLT